MMATVCDPPCNRAQTSLVRTLLAFLDHSTLVVTRLNSEMAYPYMYRIAIDGRYFSTPSDQLYLQRCATIQGGHPGGWSWSVSAPLSVMGMAISCQYSLTLQLCDELPISQHRRSLRLEQT
ncbi:hypothetical protein FRC20_008325 [Serendipita sp. 405]|nr:hypothetical protein FRC16_007960 [Serendipita sp. 398]KAG8830530.1 hypothetical protein FRC20_008325 [Serendipita sp. 405]